MNTETKTCSKCGEEKPLDEFCRHKGRKDGLSSECKACCVARSVARRKNNPEICKKNDRLYRARHPEKMKAQTRRYYLNNKEACYQRSQSGRKKSRDKLSDSYCRKLLIERGFNKEEITPELMGVHRNVIKIKRLAKEMQK